MAEKPSIAKAVAGHLSGGEQHTVGDSPELASAKRKRTDSSQRNTPNKYIKNYTFDYDFGQGWGNCNVTMTAVLGHITTTQFPAEYKDWRFPPPDSLFNAPVVTSVAEVRGKDEKSHGLADLEQSGQTRGGRQYREPSQVLSRLVHLDRL